MDKLYGPGINLLKQHSAKMTQFRNILLIFLTHSLVLLGKERVVCKEEIKKRTDLRLKRSIMDTRGTLTMELGVFVDFKLWNRFESRYGSDATAELKKFVVNVIKNIRLSYRSPTMVPKIDVLVTHYQIFKAQPASLKGPLHSEGSGSLYLKNFCKWQSRKRRRKWDHAFLLSGYSLHMKNASQAINGMAHMRGMCRKTLTCSITEGIDYSAAYTGAHELGHNLGMAHDLKICGTEHIMTPILGAGKVTWSGCSRKDLTKYLKYLDKRKMNCLRKARYREVLDIRSPEMPGETVPADQQCEAKLGIGAKQIETKFLGLHDTCYMLLCRKGNSPSGVHPALEGTYCGPGKWCVQGQCVNDNRPTDPNAAEFTPPESDLPTKPPSNSITRTATELPPIRRNEMSTQKFTNGNRRKTTEPPNERSKTIEPRIFTKPKQSTTIKSERSTEILTNDLSTTLPRKATIMSPKRSTTNRPRNTNILPPKKIIKSMPKKLIKPREEKTRTKGQTTLMNDGRFHLKPSARNNRGWTSWSETSCKNCVCSDYGESIGVQVSTRSCRDTAPGHRRGRCRGPSIRGIICRKRCPRGRLSLQDYANRICSFRRRMIPELDGRGRRGYISRSVDLSCKIHCDVKPGSGWMYRYFNDNVPDGTTCLYSSGYCLSGRCINISCSGTSLQDSSGSCPSKSDTCVVG